MIKILLFILTLTCAAEVFAQQKTQCFRNNGLRDNHIVRFEADGSDVAGSYFVETDGETEKTQTYDFSGTRTGNTLNVKFAAEAPPGVAPSKTQSPTWTLAKSGGGEILQIRFYGKNYETNEFAYYSAEFDSCEPNFATIAKQAKRISFAKGAKSAAIAIPFKAQSDWKSFRLGARKGQALSVMSPGCRISPYYPDKTADQEGGIDTFSLDILPQSGDYLFVISPAGEPGNCTTTFEISN